LLGIAPVQRLSRLIDLIVSRDAAGALGELDGALASGVEVGQLLDQMIGYFRDAMALAVGCGAEQLRYVLPSQAGEVQRVVDGLGLPAILAIGQILDHAAARLRLSVHGRTLVEMAIVRIANLEQFDELAEIVQVVREGLGPGTVASTSPRIGNAPRQSVASPTSQLSTHPAVALPDRSETMATTVEPNIEPNIEPAREPPSGSPLTGVEAQRLWQQAIGEVGDMLSSSAAHADRISAGDNMVEVSFPEAHRFDKERCERPEYKTQLEAVMSRLLGRQIRLDFSVHAEALGDVGSVPSPRPSRRQMISEIGKRPFVRRAMELFEIEPGQLKLVPPVLSG
jgi:DNA polymerase-3 subunit gamma/tau